MRKKPRILFLVPLPPPIHGASLNNLALVESKLINDSFTVEVIPFNFAVQTNDIGRFSFKKVGKSIWRALTIVYKMAKVRPDLVYFNISLYGFALYRDFIYVVIFKLFRVKLLYHLRTQSIRTQISKSRFKKSLFKYIFRNAHVICLSEYLCYDVADVYSAPPIIVNDGMEEVESFKPIVVNNGIADFGFQFENRNQFKEIPQILYLSNYAKTKGVEELIGAFKILKLGGVKFTSLLVGAPVDLSIEYLQALVNSSDLSEEVKVVGPKYGGEKHEILLDSNIFVLPTYFEAFPGAILEAMQFGLPVVSTFEGGIPEIVDEGVTGYLVPKNDQEALAEKLLLLIKDPLLRIEMGKQGRNKFLRNFTLATLEKKMKETFEKVLVTN